MSGQMLEKLLHHDKSDLRYNERTRHEIFLIYVLNYASVFPCPKRVQLQDPDGCESKYTHMSFHAIS